MDDEKPGVEENLSRLLRAGLPPDARPGAETRAEVFRRLVEMTRARADSRSFPDHLIAVIAAAIVLVTAWLVGRMAGGQGLPAAGPAATAFVLVVILNLAMVPIAGFVIVLRRRYV